MGNKYIMFESPGAGIFPVTFPEMVDHCLIANALKATHPGIKAASAGFYSVGRNALGNLRVSVWGESRTLRLHSQPDDAAFLGHLVLSEEDREIWRAEHKL